MVNMKVDESKDGLTVRFTRCWPEEPYWVTARMKKLLLLMYKSCVYSGDKKQLMKGYHS